MLELILILAVVVYLVSKLDAHHFEQARQEPMGAAKAVSAAALAEEPRPVMRLTIDGTQRPYLRNTGFVKGFGVNPKLVHDIRVYTHFGKFEHFPVALASMLTDLYDRGCAVGTEMMGLLFHGRGLKEGEAVYFALVEASPEPRIVAFIDRLRTA